MHTSCEDITRTILKGTELRVAALDIGREHLGEMLTERIYPLNNRTFEYGNEPCASLTLEFRHEYVVGSITLQINRITKTASWDFRGLKPTALGKLLGYPKFVAPLIHVYKYRPKRSIEPDIVPAEENEPKKRHEPFLRDRYGAMLGAGRRKRRQ